jgi:biotin operon repressor
MATAQVEQIAGGMVRAKKQQKKRPGDEIAVVSRRTATPAEYPGRITLADGPAVPRQFIYMAGNYLQRFERERRAVYFGDLDLAVIAEVIGTAGIEPRMRDAEFIAEFANLETVVGVEGQRAVSASSIARASGIPRETVRRKIKQLLELGFVVEKEPSRYVLMPGVLQEPHRQAAFARSIDQVIRFMNELLDKGLVRWTPSSTVRRSSRQRRPGATGNPQ